MKMYILIKEDVPLGFALNSSAHGSLACYLEFQERQDMKDWVSGRFAKVTCKVNEKEFEKAKMIPNRTIITESSLDGQEVAVVFCPRPDEAWPKMFNFFILYR